MIHYLLRRLVFAIFTLLLLSMITFGLVKYAPTDSILDQEPTRAQDDSYRQQIAEIRRTAAEKYLDRPIFYFTLTTAARPDTVERIFPYDRRERLLLLLNQSGNWSAVQQYEEKLLDAEDTASQDTSRQTRQVWIALSDVRQARQLAPLDSLAQIAQQLGQHLPVSAALQSRLTVLAHAAHTLHTDVQPAKQWTPALHWHGLDNQYHRWASAFLHGDLGYSSFSGRPVWATMRFSLLTTLLINGIAVFLAFRIAIPLGVAMARRGGRFDRMNRWLLLLLHAMPGFWLGGLLLLVFGTRHTGLHWIDGIGLDPYNPDKEPFLVWVAGNADKFILPILTLTLHALAVIALQLRGSIREVMSEDFIRTARAKGVNESKVYTYHAFRNSLIPMIAVFASVFPALFAGSVVVEYLFNFPGMGMKTVDAYDHSDYPLLFAILMLGAVMTIIGNFIGDILYVRADPRVRFDKSN